MIRHILLAGGTGLIGRSVRTPLIERADINLISLIRAGSSASGHPISFEDLCAAPDATLKPIAPQGIDVAISCLGTTRRKAGSQRAMFRVDHDYVLAFAKGAKALGARQFILVSSVGAGGAGCYLRTKGAIEGAVAELDFDRLDVVRPGFLFGQRSEVRFLESAASYLMGAITPVLPGGLSRYGLISAAVVSAAIVRLIGQTDPGRFIHENADLKELARQSQ